MADADGTHRLRAVRDRLSDLHDDLLHRIITYLPVTEAAAAAAVLASRWRHLWRSYPLVLVDGGIPDDARDALVPRVLADHAGRFRSVNLYRCSLTSLNRELPDWPRLLAARRTERLILAYMGDREPDHWDLNQASSVRLLPADILRCDSLQELRLDFWTFPSGTEVILPHLQILTMVRIVISDQDLEFLIAACPVLYSLRLILNSSKHVRLHSQSLRCALVGLCRVEGLTMVDTPLLERLYLFLARNGVWVRIVSAPNLRALGYLDTRFLTLQIGNSVIRVPSVKILALTVNFGVFREVKMLASFLRCFPNVDTLHIESAMHGPSVTANEPSREHHTRFWQEISPVYCLGSHVKKVVIHDFRGDQNEYEFLKFIAMNAQELQSLLVVSHQGILSSDDKVNEVKDELQCLQFSTGISAVLRVSPNAPILWRLEKASKLTVDDPFEC